MKLIFLGDITISEPLQIDKGTCGYFPDSDFVLANLEGPLISSYLPEQSVKQISVFNSKDVFDLLAFFDIKAVCLANNHMYDLPLPVMATKKALMAANISSFGAGINVKEANEPFCIEQQKTVIKVFAFGWDVIGCRYATGNREGVNPLEPNHVLQTAKKLRQQDEYSCVIFIFHWNYELELYPQPAHRQLAYNLIDAGVDAIVGLHPHVAQGAEIYQGKPIVYSLGNWFFPERQLGSFKLSFPSIASRELALELTITDRLVTPQFHWFQFDQRKNTLSFESSENIDGSIVKSLTPFNGLSHNAYVQWFRTHRKRRRGLPVYRDYRNTVENRFKDGYIGLRQRLITTLVKRGIKQGVSG